MTRSELALRLDHSLLKPDADLADILGALPAA